MLELSIVAVPIWIGINVAFVAARVVIDRRFPDRAHLFDAAAD